MNCRKCRARIFDCRDGTLSPREKEDLDAHLVACPRCRAELESEGEWAREFQESFKAATVSQSFDPDKERLASLETSVSSAAHANTNFPAASGDPDFAQGSTSAAKVRPLIAGKVRIFRWLAAGAIAAILSAAVLFGPLKPRKPDSLLPGRVIAGSSSLLSDDLPDPFSDWIEKRIIVTIEDKAKGTTEKFLSDRTGAIRKIAVPGRDQ
jgi:hypothetical protein